jgi:hypothetical protein
MSIVLNRCTHYDIANNSGKGDFERMLAWVFPVVGKPTQEELRQVAEAIQRQYAQQIDSLQEHRRK